MHLEKKENWMDHSVDLVQEFNIQFLVIFLFPFVSISCFFCVPSSRDVHPCTAWSAAAPQGHANTHRWFRSRKEHSFRSKDQSRLSTCQENGLSPPRRGWIRTQNTNCTDLHVIHPYISRRGFTAQWDHPPRGAIRKTTTGGWIGTTMERATWTIWWVGVQGQILTRDWCWNSAHWKKPSATVKKWVSEEDISCSTTISE